MKQSLKGYQNRYLRGISRGLKPIVLVGGKGNTHSLIDSMSRALADHEFIKIKLIDVDDRSRKKIMVKEIEKHCDCMAVGITGNTAVLYRPH